MWIYILKDHLLAPYPHVCECKSTSVGVTVSTAAFAHSNLIQ